MQIFTITVQHSMVYVTEILHMIWSDKIPSSLHDQILQSSSHAQTFQCQSMTVRCRELVIEDGGEWVSSVNRFVKWRRRLYSQCGNRHIAQHTSNNQSERRAKLGYFMSSHAELIAFRTTVPFVPLEKCLQFRIILCCPVTDPRRILLTF